MEPVRQHRIGTSVFDPVSYEITASSGQRCALRPQTAEVLVQLVEARGKLTKKSDLIERVWRDTHVTDDSLVQCISEIRKALGPEDAALLRTVPRKGYVLENTRAAQPDASSIGQYGRWRGAAVLAGLVLILIALVVWLWPKPGPEGPVSVAVLPFINIGDDPSQEYLADGIAVDLITDLSRASALTVISQTSTFAFRGKMQDIRAIGASLGVTHVVEGSVQRSGDRLRITARLVNAANGEQVWTDRFDRQASEIFTLQDEVRGEIIAALRVQLTPEEESRLARGPTENPEAYDFYLRGLRELSFFDAASNLRAQEDFEGAIAIDPKFAAAYAQLAQAYSLAIENRWNGATDSGPLIERALATARKGIELDPDLPQAYWSLGRILSRGFLEHNEEAAAVMARSIELDRNFADGHAMQTSILLKIGRADEALAHIAEAMRLNPQPPYWYYFNLGQAQLVKGDYEAAAESLSHARDQNPNVVWPRRWLIVVYGLLGMTEEAEWEAFELETMGVEVTIADFFSRVSISDQRYRDLLVEGMRKAGVPEN